MNVKTGKVKRNKTKIVKKSNKLKMTPEILNTSQKPRNRLIKIKFKNRTKQK